MTKTYSVFHYAQDHGLEAWRLLFAIPESVDYGIGSKVIVDEQGSRWHDEYHRFETIETAAAGLREEDQ